MARLAGFEPAASTFGGLHSIQVSYRRIPIILTKTGTRYIENFLIINESFQLVGIFLIHK